MRLDEFRKTINSRYKELGPSIIELLYENQDITKNGVFLNPGEIQLIIYLLAEQRGLDEIPDDLLEIEYKQFFFMSPESGNKAPAEDPDTVKSLAKDPGNRPFLQRLVDFQGNNTYQNISLIVALSSTAGINTSHFVTYSFNKSQDGTLSCTIQDSMIGGQTDLIEYQWEKYVLKELLKDSPSSRIEFNLEAVPLQNEADCLIHAVNNLLNTKLEKKHQLSAEKIQRIRVAIKDTLTGIELPERNMESPPAKPKIESTTETRADLIRRLKLDCNNINDMIYWQKQVTTGGLKYKGYILPHTVVKALKYIEKSSQLDESTFKAGLKDALTEKSNSISSLLGLSGLFRSRAVHQLREAASQDTLNTFTPPK